VGILQYQLSITGKKFKLIFCQCCTSEHPQSKVLPQRLHTGQSQGRPISGRMPHWDGITPLILKLSVKSWKDSTGTPSVSLFTGHTLPCCGHTLQGHGRYICVHSKNFMEKQVVKLSMTLDKGPMNSSNLIGQKL